MDGLRPASLTPRRVAVLAGGASAEREVSLRSGAAVLDALSLRNHIVTLIDPSEVALNSVDWSRFELAFLALHGTFGEDGGVQSLLERLGVIYTGSSAVVSRLAFNKSATKERLRLSGVPTPASVLIHETDSLESIQRHAGQLGYPLVVKPNEQGSSIGVTIVRAPAELPAAVENCFRFGAFGLLEVAIVGSEWTLGVIDHDPLPLIHIATQREFFNFEAKYEDDGTQYLFEPNLDPAVRTRLTEVGLAACQALGTTGVSRTDIMVDADGQPWVLEVNTIPGMTDHSLVPKAALRAGLDMSQLCELLIERALTGTPEAVPARRLTCVS